LYPDVAPKLIIELLGFGMVSSESLPPVISLLTAAKCPLFYGMAHDTLFWVASQAGCDNISIIAGMGVRLTINRCILSAEGTDALIQGAESPFTECTLGKIIHALLVFLTDVYELVEHDATENISLMAMARFLTRLFPAKALELMRRVVKVQNGPAEMRMISDMLKDYVAESNAACFASLFIAEFGAVNALKVCPDVCLWGCKSDRLVASMIAELLEQPLPIMPTFLSFAFIERHAEWVQTCRCEIPKELWILQQGDDGYVQKEPVGEAVHEAIEAR